MNKLDLNLFYSLKTPRVKGEFFFVTLFFAIFFMVGLFTYQDYGVSWDEPIQRGIGNANINYITGHDRSLLEMKDRYYGPIFEILLIGVEKTVQPASLREVFFLRHFVIFTAFFGGTFFFYFLARNIYKKPITALISTVALVLSPIIFGNSFYNSKDIPLLVFFIICFTLFFLYIDTKRISLLILLAFFSAVTVTIRIAGLLIPFLTVMSVCIEVMTSPENFKRKIAQTIPKLSLFLILLIIFTIAAWPILWSNPIMNLLNAVKETSHFDWDHTVLFMGTNYSASAIPSIYPIVWILISTPVAYSLLFFTGVSYLFIGNMRSGSSYFSKSRLKLFLIAIWFFFPLILVIILKSVLYDSWRHLFFIYPAFILLAFYGFERLNDQMNNLFARTVWPSVILHLLIVITFLSTILFMVKAHPYEHVYFNFLAGNSFREVKNNYDMDYWGLAYKKGLEYISRNDQSPVIPYVSETAPGSYNFILLEEDQKRLVPIQDENTANYLITNYRWRKSYPGYQEVFSVEVEGAKILSVFKLK